jgi:lipopolysaccharide export system protein LptA
VKRLAVIACLLLNLSPPVLAAPKPKAGLLNAPRGPISIRSDTLKVMQKKNKAVFSGNVHAIQGELLIRCKQLEVLYSDSTESKGKSSEIRSMIFTGDVAINQGERRGHCQKATYDRVAERIVCVGKPWVIEGANRIDGDQITYLLARDEVQVIRPKAVLHLPDKPVAPTDRNRP